MGYKSRKRLALLVLVLGLPIYIAVAATIMSNLMTNAWRFPMAVEFVIYVALGVGWAFPLKWLFKGIGQPDPDQSP